MSPRYTINYQEGNHLTPHSNPDQVFNNSNSPEGWTCTIHDSETNLNSVKWALTKGEAQEKAFEELNRQNNFVSNQATKLEIMPDQEEEEEEEENDAYSDEDEEGSDQSESSSRKSKNSSLKVAGILILLFSVLAAGFAFYLNMNLKESSSPKTNASSSAANTSESTPGINQPMSNQVSQKNIPKNQNSNSGTTSNTNVSSNVDASSQKSAVSLAENDFYILNTTAVKTEGEAIRKAEELRAKGYSTGYLWIPDYASLSKRPLYTVYIGPFYSQYDCEKATENFRKIVPGAYGTLVSQQKIRVQINGIGKVMISALDSASEPCSNLGERYSKNIIVQEDNIRVRQVPNSKQDATILFRLFKDDKGMLLDSTINTSGEKWYKICYQNSIGWIISDYVIIQ